MKSDIIGKFLELRRIITRTPKNSKEAMQTINKLLKMNKHFNPNYEINYWKNKEQSSKRFNRLIKMYWIYIRQGA